MWGEWGRFFFLKEEMADSNLGKIAGKQSDLATEGGRERGDYDPPGSMNKIAIRGHLDSVFC